MFEKIPVCLDGSKLAEQILPYAEAQALSFGSKVVLLQVLPLPSPPFTSGATLPVHAGHMVEEQAEKEEGAAKTYLERVAESLRAKGLAVECVTRQGDPVGEAITSYADQNQIDLIAISTHGHSGLARLVSGSVADYVLRRTGLPMLVIRPKEMKQE